MKFGERVKRALKKIKDKLIVFVVLFLVICVWGLAPLTRAYISATNKVVEFDGRRGSVVEITQEEAERQFIEEDRERPTGWENFIQTLLVGLANPIGALKKCFQVEPVDYLTGYAKCVGFSGVLAFLCVFIGVMRAMPKHEYEDIENGSSDWCEGGEQYTILHKSKGIVLAEKNYLPVDKRGNVNVLVVRRVWCW